MQVRGSVTSSSSLITGLVSNTTSGVLVPNAFLTSEFLVDNASNSSTVTFPIVAWFDASGNIPAGSDLINFIDDIESIYYIPEEDRAGLAISYIVTGAGLQSQAISQSSYTFNNLTNGIKYPVQIQGSYQFTPAGAEPVTVFSQQYFIELKPAGGPTIDNTNIIYTYTIIDASRNPINGSTQLYNQIPAGATNIQSVFSATISGNGADLVSYTVIYVPIDFSTAILQSAMIPAPVNFTPVPTNFVNGVLTLTPSFVAKACILYVTNTNTSNVEIIPTGGLSPV
jgi:hypothetical protein